MSILNLMPLGHLTKKDFKDKAVVRKAKSSAISGILGLLLFLGLVMLFFVSMRASWNGLTRWTVAIESPLSLVSYNPADGLLTVVPLPGTLELPVVEGYGLYRADKLVPLDKQERKNGSLLMGTLASSLGVPVSGWIETTKNSYVDGGNGSDRLSLLWGWLRGNLRFHMGVWDTLKWIFTVGGVRGSDIQMVDLSGKGFVMAETAPDGTVGMGLVTDQWDLWERKNLFDPAVEREGLSIAVVNGALKTGLATEATWAIEGVGGRVVVVRDGSGDVGGCTVGGKKDLAKSQTVELIRKILNCNWKEEDTESYRSDLVVTVGEDYNQFLHGKD